MPFIIKAVIKSLKEFPRFNSSLDHLGENLVLKNYYKIGIAVDTPTGLVVPVIKNADNKSILGLSEELMDISERARTGKLKPDEFKGGCFTISSLGGIGGTNFTPIINPPEVAIMGVSKSMWKPVYDHKNKEIVPTFMMPFSLSYDHRVIDGAAGALFTTQLTNILGNEKNIVDSKIFFYLDAHSEGDYPLIEELDYIVNNVKEFVILIDDFQVPDDEGYGYDSFMGRKLNIKFIRDVIKQNFSFYFPSISSSEETGRLRGYI